MIFYDLSKHSAQRLADAANRNGLQLLVLLHIVADVRRDDTPPESQPRAGSYPRFARNEESYWSTRSAVSCPQEYIPFQFLI